MSRLPLRARVMAWFGLVSLVVTSALAILTWQLSTGYMVDQRERSAIQQAMGNARLVEQVLRRGPDGVGELLTGVGAEFDSAVLLIDGGKWVGGGGLANPRRLPEELLSMARTGQAAHQRIVLDGLPALAVALPLPGMSATYLEVSPMRELDRTFRFLSWILIAGAAASGVAGGLLGRWAATYALRPLSRMTSVAAEAAAGDLAVRLPATRDPDLVRLTEAFNDTAERLEQRVVRDARFAGDVSHELRSPLTTMINAMAVLHRRRTELPANARQAVELLDTDLRRFRRMVDDLLEISRDYQGLDQLHLELVDLCELVRQAAMDHGRPLTAGVLDTAGATPIVADRRCLERVVANLLDNAERHGNGLVRIGVLRRDGNARIEVDDAGPGVLPADRDHIFERFSRGSPADRDASDSGVGLGLAIVAQHARRHGGSAWVEERPGGGARFVVELPEVTE